MLKTPLSPPSPPQCTTSCASPPVGVGRPVLVVPWVVMQELDGLKVRGNRDTTVFRTSPEQLGSNPSVLIGEVSSCQSSLYTPLCSWDSRHCPH